MYSINLYLSLRPTKGLFFLCCAQPLIPYTSNRGILPRHCYEYCLGSELLLFISRSREAAYVWM